jgi:hypothetical protein
MDALLRVSEGAAGTRVELPAARCRDCARLCGSWNSGVFQYIGSLTAGFRRGLNR